MTRRLGLVLAIAGLQATGGAGCNKGETVVAPTLTAQCAANPASGTAPLTVAFNLSVAGAQGSFSVAINYGDGTEGTDPDRPHTYAAAGAFAASFTVSTSSQSARCSTTVTVSPAPSPPPPPNRPPNPVFKTVPAAVGGTISGTAPFVVHLNMCQTVDPDGDRLLFTIDFDGDGNPEVRGPTGADCRQEHTYAAGTYTAIMCVSDINCQTWPACVGVPVLHRFQCKQYTVVATP